MTPRTSLLPEAAAKADTSQLMDAGLAGCLLGGGSMLMLSLIPKANAFHLTS